MPCDRRRIKLRTAEINQEKSVSKVPPIVLTIARCLLTLQNPLKRRILEKVNP